MNEQLMQIIEQHREELPAAALRNLERALRGEVEVHQVTLPEDIIKPKAKGCGGCRRKIGE